MLCRILKKDLKRRRGVNIILFLFITLATVFLAGSVNNILVVTSAIDYYTAYARVPDVNFILSDTSNIKEIDAWLESEAENMKDYDYNTLLMPADKDISVVRDKKKYAYEAEGASIYLGTTDADYNKVFDYNGKAFELNQGEAALPQIVMNHNHLETGDKLIIHRNGMEKEFTVKLVVKDAAFGSGMVGMNRIIIGKEDYESFKEDGQFDEIGLYYINSDKPDEFQQELNSREFTGVMSTITKDTYNTIYSFDMIMAALLILIGICLILIALLVLRFTLVFTIEEDYREIGIMKAQGFRDFAIKKLYLVKYLLIVMTGSLLGLVISVPVSSLMVKSVSENMLMEDGTSNIEVNILCTVVIIALVLLFCYASTRKLNKVSAITAIRGGQTGERFNRRAGLKLSSKKHIPVCTFLGLNDMASHVKRYVVLMITFCLSFILITIPLNTINTMQSDEMTAKFALDPESAVYVRRIEKPGEGTYRSSEDFKQGIKRVQSELKSEGYDAELSSVIFYFFRYDQGGKRSSDNIMTLQMIGPDNKYLDYSKGEAPRYANEIAFSKTVLEENGWNIGDTVQTTINGEKEELLITGTYSDYMQVGRSARLNPKIDLSKEPVTDCWNTMVNIKTEKTQEEMASELKKLFPDYEWSSAQEILNSNIGGIQKSLKDMLLPMTGMLCAVIMLITVLMEKLFIIREKGEIAMMKSIGFKNKDIRKWQVLRMVFVVAVSMIAAIPLSLLSNQFILKPIFAIMGAELNIQVVPWQVYGVYPGILLVGIIAAAAFASGGIKKVNIQELNNLE